MRRSRSRPSSTTTSDRRAIRDRRARTAFLGLALAVTSLMTFAAVVLVPLAGGFDVRAFWAAPGTAATLGQRSPYLLQAFGNLLLFLIVCGCGAALFTERARRQGAAVVVIAIVAGVCGVFLHAMVWGVDLIFPSSGSLLAPYGQPLIVFDAITTAPYGSNAVANAIVSALIHLLAPQVLLAGVVLVLAVRRLVRPRPGRAP